MTLIKGYAEKFGWEFRKGDITKKHTPIGTVINEKNEARFNYKGTLFRLVEDYQTGVLFESDEDSIPVFLVVEHSFLSNNFYLFPKTTLWSFIHSKLLKQEFGMYSFDNNEFTRLILSQEKFNEIIKSNKVVIHTKRNGNLNAITLYIKNSSADSETVEKLLQMANVLVDHLSE